MTSQMYHWVWMKTVVVDPASSLHLQWRWAKQLEQQRVDGTGQLMLCVCSQSDTTKGALQRFMPIKWRLVQGRTGEPSLIASPINSWFTLENLPKMQVRGVAMALPKDVLPSTAKVLSTLLASTWSVFPVKPVRLREGEGLRLIWGSSPAAIVRLHHGNNYKAPKWM